MDLTDRFDGVMSNCRRVSPKPTHRYGAVGKLDALGYRVGADMPLNNLGSVEFKQPHRDSLRPNCAQHSFEPIRSLRLSSAFRADRPATKPSR